MPVPVLRCWLAAVVRRPAEVVEVAAELPPAATMALRRPRATVVVLVSGGIVVCVACAAASQ